MVPRAAACAGEDELARVRERAAAWVLESCAAQGVPAKVSDPLILAQVAALLPAARPARPPRRASRQSG